MGTHYQQLSIVERCEIARLRTAGCSVPEIAAALDRATSTITRELNRNASANGGYQPEYVQQPAQVSGRLALDYGRPVISHASIYGFIYAQPARTKDYSWRLYLPRGKSKRGWRGRRQCHRPHSGLDAATNSNIARAQPGGW